MVHRYDLSQADAPFALAFYLPQFHPIAENDRWWGKGFTEWTNVAKAKPRFDGHVQPRLPGELGFYDLRLDDVMDAQVALAKRYGVGAWVFYYYRFGSKRLLNQPVDRFLERGGPDIGFCYCWANENWTRAWDGRTREVLMQQDYSEASLALVADDAARAFADPRHVRADGAPVFLIYQVEHLVEGGGAVETLRRLLGERGWPRVHVCAVQSWGLKRPEDFGVDAVIDFPPHRLARETQERALLGIEAAPGADPARGDHFEAYEDVIRAQSKAGAPGPRYPAVTPAWDNTPRRETAAHMLIGATPERFADWTEQAARRAWRDWRAGRIAAPAFFVNAWNEWAEGAMLEPDAVSGRSRLRAFARGLSRATAKIKRTTPAKARRRIARSRGLEG